MRVGIIYYIIIFLLSINLYSSSIDEQIKSLENIPTKDRYKLMNKIKRSLVKLNIQQRKKAIMKLQKNMAIKVNHNTTTIKQQYTKKPEIHIVQKIHIVNTIKNDTTHTNVNTKQQKQPNHKDKHSKK
jgi:hypothetical protein